MAEPIVVDGAAGTDATLVAEWDALADEAGASPFLRPGWIYAWWGAFGGGRLAPVVVRRAGALAGVLPLVRRRGQVASATNYHSPEFGLLAVDEAASSALVGAALAARPRRLSLSLLAADDAARVRASASAAGYAIVERASQRSPEVELTQGRAAYERALSKNLRGDVGRRRRRLEEVGAVEVEVTPGGERLDALLEEGFGLEGSGWKDARGTAIRSSGTTRRFYTDVARWAAERGWLRLAYLRVDGRAIAFHYDLVAGGVLYHLKGGYDPAYERFSPGKLLHWELVARAFDEGLRRYDFLGGDEFYKAQFATGSRELVLLEALAPTPSGRASRFVLTTARPLAKRALARVRS